MAGAEVTERDTIGVLDTLWFDQRSLVTTVLPVGLSKVSAKDCTAPPSALAVGQTSFLANLLLFTCVVVCLG